MNEHIVAIVVTYQPDLDTLDELLNSIINQVHTVLIVDNGLGLDHFSSRYPDPRVRFLSTGFNKGIAAAQNLGVTLARQLNANFVLFFDQDSVAAPDMVRKLLEAFKALSAVASIGPRYFDTRQDNPPPFIRIKGLRLHRCKCNTADTVLPVDYLISSGCLIPMSVLDRVGGMREDLFIDYVDIEWGLRARHQGFQSYGVCSAYMRHSLGDHPINFFGKNIPLHSPLRHYYHFRNAVLLYREAWVPLNWKLVDGWRLCLKYVFYSVFAKPRMAHWRMMTLGLWHGLKGKAGRLEGRAS
jgi:rhamnosyltransferase